MLGLGKHPNDGRQQLMYGVGYLVDVATQRERVGECRGRTRERANDRGNLSGQVELAAVVHGQPVLPPLALFG
jgi:hypothetical protein